jgi:hypothetical protein
MKQRIPELRKRLEAAGRDPDGLEISVYGSVPTADSVAAYEAAGLDRLVFSLPCREPEEVRATLDRYAALVR